MPNDETVKMLVAALVAAIGVASGLVAILKHRNGNGNGRQHSKLEDVIDERVLHKLANFTMYYRPVIEALSRGDHASMIEALDRVDDEVRNQARLTAERLRR